MIHNSEKLQAFPLRSGTRQGCPLLLILFNKVLKVLATEMSRKWEKSLQIQKEEVKLCLFLEDMILYIEKPKDSTKKKKRLEIINEFSKVAGYKINIKKSAAFLSTNNKCNGMLWEITEELSISCGEQKNFLGEDAISTQS